MNKFISIKNNKINTNQFRKSNTRVLLADTGSLYRQGVRTITLTLLIVNYGFVFYIQGVDLHCKSDEGHTFVWRSKPVNVFCNFIPLINIVFFSDIRKRIIHDFPIKFYKIIYSKLQQIACFLQEGLKHSCNICSIFPSYYLCYFTTFSNINIHLCFENYINDSS